MRLSRKRARSLRVAAVSAVTAGALASSLLAGAQGASAAEAVPSSGPGLPELCVQTTPVEAVSPSPTPSRSPSPEPVEAPSAAEPEVTPNSEPSSSTLELRERPIDASAMAEDSAPAAVETPRASASSPPAEAPSPSLSPSSTPSPTPTESASPRESLSAEPEAEPDSESEPLVESSVVCPLPVVDVRAVGIDHAMDITWTADPEGALPSEFWVQVDGRFERTEGTSIRIAGLRNGQEYEAVVYAATADGRSQGAQPVRAVPSNGAEGVVAGLIVEFAPGVADSVGTQQVAGEAEVDVDLQVTGDVSGDAVLVELAEPVDLATAEQIAEQLEADPGVEWAEPDQFLFTASDPTTPSPEAAGAWNLSGQFGVDASGSDSGSSDGQGVTVAVIDTGTTDHPALRSRSVSGYDFVSSPEQLAASRQANAPPVSFDADYQNESAFGAIGRDANPADPGDWRETSPARSSSWHGTKMAGLVAEVAPGASIQPIRALSWRGGLLSDIAASITWASGGTVDGVPANANPSKVINMSFSVEATCPVAMQDAIDEARGRGAILVAAAGNANDDAAKYAPGNCSGVITVGSTTSSGVRAGYSNYGPVVDIAAPGGDNAAPVQAPSNTGTTSPDQPTRTGDFGTSVSAAHVSAGAAVLAAGNPTISPDAAYRALTGRDYIKAFANSTCDTNPDYSCGAGILSLAQIATISSGDQDFAMSFNGTSQYAQGGAEALGTGALSLEAWVKPASSCSAYGTVIRQEDGYFLMCEAGVWKFLTKSAAGGSWTTFTTSSAVQSGQWQHIAVTRSASGAVSFYFNGQLASTASSQPLINSTEPISIGADLYGLASNSGQFNGVIDEVRMFASERSGSEVAADMHTYGPTSTSGLLAYYDFNEGPAGTTGTGTVYNRASGATSATNLRTVNGPTYADIKQTTSNGSNTVVTFPRSYLTAAGGWRAPDGVSSTRALVVGGGGGGGAWVGGGGGGGGVTATSSVSVSPGRAITVTVGQGGLGAQRTSTLVSGGNGNASTLGSPSPVTALGGGVGATNVNQAPGSGSGVATGGGGAYSSGTYAGGSGAITSGGSANFDGQPHPTGGGGGAGGNGGSGTGSGSSWASGNGGVGVASDITGASVYYGGGGGGSAHGTWSSATSWNSSVVITAGSGGQGGGGAGGRVTTSSPTTSSVVGVAGTAGLGGGGGGAANFWDSASSYTSIGGNGGSGIVIVSYSTAASGTCVPEETQYASGGTTYRVVAFKDTGSCTWTVPAGVTSVDGLLVGGGGGGGGSIGGGGGAGEFKSLSAVSVTSGNSQTIVVGAGGAPGVSGSSSGSNGSNSSALTYSVKGGGGGATLQYAAAAGGSGGGGLSCGYSSSLAPGAGTSSLSSGSVSSGGSGSTVGSAACVAGGGGGAGGAGSNFSGQSGGAGGAGVSSSITGAALFYAAGGGGGINGDVGALSSGTAGAGGSGIGGAGGGKYPSTNLFGNAATANTGSGGGGASNASTGGRGASGIVILRYVYPSGAACAPSESTYTSGGTTYTIVEFQGAGTCSWTPPAGVASVDVLAVGGGGGGGSRIGGGGGGGAVIESSAVSVSGATSVTVGAGGRGGYGTTSSTVGGAQGGQSALGAVTAIGGGGGGGDDGYSSNAYEAPKSGGGGGGGGWNGSLTSTGRNSAGASGAPGGSGGSSTIVSLSPIVVTAGGGGGGAALAGTDSEIGGNGTSTSGGVGGSGGPSSITGATVYYGGGGGGGVHTDGTATAPGPGGLGGGGAGATLAMTTALSGADGLGGGGGGGSVNTQTISQSTGGDGGNGVIIVSYTTTPGAPTSVAGSASAPTTATVSWTAPTHTGGSSITGYSVVVSAGGGAYAAAAAGTCTSASSSTSTSCTVTGLTAGTTYAFKVTAINANGSGTQSDASAAITAYGALSQFAVTATDGSALGTQVAGTSFNIKVTAQDSGGRTVTNFTGTVDLTSTSLFSSGTSTTTSAFTAGVLSSHAVTLLRAGSSETVTATKTSSTETGTSGTFTISAGTATKLQVLLPGETAAPGTSTGKTGTPTDDVAGSGITATVNAVDANWNVVSSATQTITITSSDSAATLPSNAALVSGTKDFSVTLKTAGSRTITATVASGASLTAGSSDSVTVTAASASQLVVSSIGSQTAGTAFDVTVTLTDAYSNAVNNTGATGTVTLTRGSGTGTVGGTVSGTIAVGASAVTISGVTYSKAESGVTLTATGTGASSLVLGKTGTSVAFTVTSGAASQYGVTLSSAIPTAGGTVTVTAQLQDANGNDVATSGKVVTWSTTATGGSFASSTSTTNASGVATVVYTVSQVAGVTGTITATDDTTPTSLTGTSASLTTQVGAATKLQVLLPGETAAPGTASGKTGTPTAQTALTAFTVTVNAVDQYWNVVTSATQTISITSSDSSAALPSNAALSSGTRGFSVTMGKAGSFTVTATVASGATLTASTSTAVTVNRATQVTLSISSPSTITFGDSQALTSTGGSSSEPVTYAVTTTGTAGCSISGSTLTTTGAAGTTCGVTATRGQDDTYSTATSAEQTITVTTRSITVTASSPSIAYGAAVSPTVSVTSGSLSGSDAISGATFTYAGTGGTTYASSTTAPTAVGTYSVTPSAAVFSSGSSSNYTIAYAAGTLTIGKADQATLTFTTTSATLGGSTTLTTSGGSGTGSDTFTLVSSGTAGCSLSGAVLSYTSGGTCTISATKAGDSSYNSATTGTVTFTVSGPSTTTSTISAGLSSVTANGTSTTTITVQLKDSSGNDVTTNAATVALATTAGTLGSVTYAGSGSYTATLTAPTTVSTATISGTLNSLAMTDIATVSFVAGAAAKVLVVTAPVAGASEASLSTQPVVWIADAYDNRITSSTASVTVTASAGTLGGTATVAAVNGIVTFAGLTYTGSDSTASTLTFASSTLSSATANVTATGPGATSALTLQTSGSGGSSGTAFTTQPAVAVTDASGNTVTSDNSTVVTAAVSSGGTLVGTTTATAVSGVATFSDLGIAGTLGTAYTITYSSGALTTATQSATPAAGAATQLLITQASVGTASGAAFTTQPAITVTDSAGNAVTSYAASTVTATVSSGGTLVGTTTATTSSGVATFSDLGITGTAGSTYTITYAVSGLTSATASVTVTVGSATQILVSTQPVAGRSGAALSTQPVVRIADSGGNTVTSDSSTSVTVAASGGTLSGTTAVTAASGEVQYAGLTFAGLTTSTYTLSFSASGLTATTSSSIQPSGAGTATQVLMVTEPVAGGSGSALTTQPVVRLADSAGNTVATDSTTSVTVTASGGTLGGTTSVTASSGNVTFAGLTFAALRTSTYTLTFAASGLTSATSSSITPSAVGPLAQFAVTQTGGTNPLSAGSYSAGTWAYARVTAQDSAGNTVTTFSGTVSLYSDAWPSPVSVSSFTSGVKDSVGFYPRVAGTGFTVRATYSAGSITTNPASSTFTVEAGAATKLLVDTAPVGGASGTQMTTQPAVRVTDYFDNTVTSSTATVTVSTPTSAWQWPTGAGASTDINAVAYSGSTWVGVSCGLAAKSVDAGLTWTYSALPVQTCWNGVAYGNGLWVTVSNSGVYSSSDGVTWTQRNATGMGDVAYGNGVWVAVHYTNRSLVSTDGITWTPNTGYMFDEVEFGDGQFWAATQNGSVSRSLDGSRWISISGPGGSGDIYDLAVGNGRIVVARNGSVSSTLTSSVSWTTTSVSGIWYSVGFGNNEFRAGSNSGYWMSSQDGLTWTTPALATAVAGGTVPSLYTMEYGGGTWVTGGNASSDAIMIDTASAPVITGTQSVTAVNGVATFTDLTLAGAPGTSYPMTFSSSGLTSVTSTASPSAVGALDVAQTTVTTSASSIAAGSGTTTVTVQLRDSAGNAVSSTGQSVALTVSSGTLSSVTDNGGGSYTATLTAAALQTIAVVRATVSGTSAPSAASVAYTVGAAAAVVIERQPVAGAAGAVLSTQPQVKVVDANGNALTAQTYRVTVTSSGGTLGGSNATYGIDTSTTTGIGTFNNLTFAGLAGSSYPLTFAVSGLTSATSDPITPSGAGSATTIAVSAGNSQSASIGTAVATPPAVIVTDAGGNPIAGRSITFAVASGGGSATGLSATTNSSGIATVGSWTLGSTLGANTLTATSAGLTGSPLTFTATAVAGPLASLSFTRQSTGTASGAAFSVQPRLTLKDASNNTLTLDSTSVVTASVSSGGQLVGTTTATAQLGIATFTDLGITGTAGTAYTITYSIGVITNSQSVTVTVGAAASLGVSTAAAGASYGVTWTTQPAIAILDSGGNRVTSDSSTAVNVAVSAGGTLAGSVAATASSGLATFSGLSLTGTPASYTLTFSTGSLATTTQSLALSQAPQTIAFGSLSNATYGDAPIVISATASSGLAVTFASSDTTVCSVTGAIVSIVGVGTCTITASQSGNANYLAAGSVQQSFAVARAAQATLTMSSSGSAIYGETISLAASGGSGTGMVTFTATDGTATGCAASGSTLSYTTVGTCSVTAQRASDTNYNARSSSAQTVTIAKAAQTLAFTSSVPASPLPNGTYMPLVTSVSAVTGSSTGITPTLAVSGACTLSGGVVTFSATGPCTVTASASATYTNYLNAADVTQVIAVGSLNQNITFAQPSSVSFGSSSVSMGATASSHLTVDYQLGSGTTGYGTAGAACSVTSLGAVTILAVGTCEVVAMQAGDPQYAPASDVTRSFEIVAATASAPSLTSASASDQSITVGFTVPGFNGGVTVTAYRVVATPVSSGTAVTTTACTVSPCTISGLANGTAYTVTVAAINSAGVGTASSASTALTPATAAFAVGALAATPGNTYVDVDWQRPVNLGGGVFTRYDLYFRVAGTSYGSAIAISPTTPGDITTAPTTYRVTGLDNGTSYDFKVVTITSANNSEIPGNTAEVVQYPSTVPSAPTAPTVLLASVTSVTDVQFSWSSPVTDGGASITGYTATVTSSTTGASTPITCTVSGVTPRCLASNLTNGASYTFSVVATNRMGNSPVATTTYNVPSSDATLSNLVVEGESGVISLSPSFASGTTTYTATVPYDISSVTITPTTSVAGATVEVDGSTVLSGEASTAIALIVGSTTIEIDVTASDPRYSEGYEVTVTRQPAPSRSGGGSSGASPGVPVAPPSTVANGSVPGAVTENGSVRSDVQLTPLSNGAGWQAQSSDFAMSIQAESSSGRPEPLAGNGAMQTQQGGRIVLNADGYAPSTQISVFAVPRTTVRAVARVAVRSVSNAVYVGSTMTTGSGSANATFIVPSDLAVGDYVLQINGITPQEQVRSVNLLLDITPALLPKAGLLREAAFYEGGTDRLSSAGKAKLLAMVSAIPADAEAVKVNVVGVSTALGTSRANLELAKERAQRIVDFLEARGVDGIYTVTVSTTFELQSSNTRGADKAADASVALDTPMTSSVGKPLTTASIAFTASPTTP